MFRYTELKLVYIISKSLWIPFQFQEVNGLGYPVLKQCSDLPTFMIVHKPRGRTFEKTSGAFLL